MDRSAALFSGSRGPIVSLLTIAAALSTACFSTPDYAGGGRLDQLPAAVDAAVTGPANDAATTGGNDVSVPPPVDAGIDAPADSFAAPVDASETGGDP